jgi:hypothetical protein
MLFRKRKASEGDLGALQLHHDRVERIQEQREESQGDTMQQSLNYCGQLEVDLPMSKYSVAMRITLCSAECGWGAGGVCSACVVPECEAGFPRGRSRCMGDTVPTRRRAHGAVINASPAFRAGNRAEGTGNCEIRAAHFGCLTVRQKWTAHMLERDDHG